MRFLRFPPFAFLRHVPHVAAAIVAAATVVLASPSTARAEAASSSSQETAPPGARGVSLAIGPELGGLREPYLEAAITPSFRFGRHFVLALGVSYGWGPGSMSCADGGFSGGAGGCDGESERFLRVALEPRHVFVLGSAAEVWTGLAVGAADVMVLPLDGGTRHFAAPLVGAGIGLDLIPARELTFGLEMRADAMAFGNGDVPYSVPRGLAGGAHAGLVLGFHLPI
jgi:hypothetical protein